MSDITREGPFEIDSLYIRALRSRINELFAHYPGNIEHDLRTYYEQDNLMIAFGWQNEVTGTLQGPFLWNAGPEPLPAEALDLSEIEQRIRWLERLDDPT